MILIERRFIPFEFHGILFLPLLAHGVLVWQDFGLLPWFQVGIVFYDFFLFTLELTQLRLNFLLGLLVVFVLGLDVSWVAKLIIRVIGTFEKCLAEDIFTVGIFFPPFIWMVHVLADNVTIILTHHTALAWCRDAGPCCTRLQTTSESEHL
jgi:hypothetical protein